MVKLVLFLTRRPDLSPAQFADYWRRVHAPLVLRVPNIRRYVISPRTVALAGEPMPDGIAELWFDDMAALDEATRSPAWLDARADGANFRINSVAFVTEEEQLLP